MEFEKFDNKKIDDIYNALCCRGLYMVECRDEKCPYHTDKYLPIEPCDIVQLREDFKNMINYLKATDVEPVKHGRWVGMREYCQHLFDTTGERYTMSQLGISLPHCNQCWTENESRKPFCPNCGAKMDAEQMKEEGKEIK